MISPTMPAAVLQNYGVAPDYLSWASPARSPGTALIRVLAAPISPLDLLCASGKSYFGAPPLPYIPGVQGVGIVEEGETLAPGQRVWFSCNAGMKPGNGSMAGYCVAEETAALVLPPEVESEAVAALGLSAIAAWMALSWRGKLQPGEQVLVLGASGAVGQVAVQAAKLLGARRVVAAARNAEGRNLALKLGADAVVDLNSNDIDELYQRIASQCEGPLHLVIDPVWGLPAQAALRVLATEGRLVNIGAAAGATVPVESATLRSRLHNILGYTNNALDNAQKAQALQQILAYAAEGRLVVQRETLPLAHIGEAWTRQATSAHRKLILVPG